MGANPHANGGALLRDLRMPDFRAYAVDVPKPGVRGIGDTHVLGQFLRDVIKLNWSRRISGSSGPTRPLSNGLEALFEVTQRQWEAETTPNDEFLAPTGRVMEMLSEHQCEGWLEGYLLTGRHGLFNCYEAFIHIVDSMFNQHAKWLKVTAHLPWRRKIASSTTFSPRTCGARTTTDSLTRTPASSTTFRTRNPRWSGSICRRTQIACFR